MSSDPIIWGPHMWVFLHTLSFEYPDNPTDKEKDHYYTFFKTLKYILPCTVCKKHYTTFFDNNPIRSSLNNKDSLIRWVLKSHNNVNKSNNKPEWTYTMLVDKYANIYKKSVYNHITYKNYSIILSIICLLFIIYKTITK